MGTTTIYRSQQGFSLIELLIVVAIILIIMSIALPELMNARMSANESAAVSNMRTIVTAETAYSVEYNQGYSTQLSQLGGVGVAPSPSNALLIDSALASGTKSGFQYIYSSTGSAFTINANPVSLNLTGRR